MKLITKINDDTRSDAQHSLCTIQQLNNTRSRPASWAWHYTTLELGSLLLKSAATVLYTTST